MSRARKDFTTLQPADQEIPRDQHDVSVVEGLSVPFELLRPLTSTQVTAADLYDRGLNVFPVPRPEEVRTWAARNPEKRDPNAKPPYLNRPLFTSRMHKCDDECKQKQAKKGRLCLPQYATFESLFKRTNIAVMLGRTSENLFVIDCDSHSAFLEIRDELKQHNLSYWAYTSHRGGGYLMRLAEGEVKNMPKDGKTPSPFANVEIFGNRHYVVLPPSLHPAGTFYQWVPGCPGEPLHNLPPGEPPPLVRIVDVEWLGVTLAKNSSTTWENPELVDGIPWTIYLSRNNRRILNSILFEGTRNTNLTKPTYDIAALINDGAVDYSDGLQLLMIAADRSGYPRDSIRQMLRAAMHKPGLTPAVEHYRDLSASQDKPWEKALTFAENWRWSGRTAQSDRSVFLACTERARLDNRSVFRCAEREIAELANCAHKTARYALRRLRGDVNSAVTPKLLKYVCRDIQSGASMYSFSEFPTTPSTCTPLSPLVVCGGVNMEGQIPATASEQDLFRRHKVAWRVWRHLCKQSEPSKAAIERAVGIPWSSVSRSLEWLMQLGMVSYSNAEGRYYGELFTDEALAEIAKSLGLTGISEKQRAYHELERQKRVNYMLASARDGWSRR